MIAGCAATTSLQLIPAQQQPVCQGSVKAKVIWAPQWRPDQKDVADREAAASEGMSQFFSNSGCFSSTSLQRVADLSASTIQAALDDAGSRQERLVVIAVRELGPVLKIGSSVALIEGGTEVVLEVAEHRIPGAQPRQYTIHWRNGGPGVIKGVATLPQDMSAALSAGLQPAPAR